MPILQWMYFDALECLGEEDSMLTEEDCAPVCVHYHIPQMYHTINRCAYEWSLYSIAWKWSFPPLSSSRGTAGTMGRSLCLAPSCRMHLLNSATSWWVIVVVDIICCCKPTVETVFILTEASTTIMLTSGIKHLTYMKYSVSYGTQFLAVDM